MTAIYYLSHVTDVTNDQLTVNTVLPGAPPVSWCSVLGCCSVGKRGAAGRSPVPFVNGKDPV